MSVRLPISCLSQFKPQKSFIAPKTVEARIELVPNPEPAGIAESSVTSIPAPNERSLASSEGQDSAENQGGSRPAPRLL